MAKLAAHGYEIARITVHEDERPEGASTLAESCVYSFRSDGHILRCLKVKFGPNWLDADGYWHNYGWKLWKRFSDRQINAERVRNYANRMACRFEAKGLRVEREGV